MASIVRIKEVYNIPSKRKCNSNSNQSIKGASHAIEFIKKYDRIMIIQTRDLN